MSSKLKGWLTKRRELKIIDLSGKHVALVVDTVNEFFNALIDLQNGDVDSSLKGLARMSHAEEEADSLDRQIAVEATKGDLPPKDREDLLHLTRRVDYVADWTKDAGKNLELLINKGVKLSDDLLQKIVELTKLLKEAALTLQKAIINITTDIDAALEYVHKVEEREHAIDLRYYAIKETLFDYDFSPMETIVIRDMANDIERASDLAEDAGDIIKIIAVRVKE